VDQSFSKRLYDPEIIVANSLIMRFAASSSGIGKFSNLLCGCLAGPQSAPCSKSIQSFPSLRIADARHPIGSGAGSILEPFKGLVLSILAHKHPTKEVKVIFMFHFGFDMYSDFRA
jgi:hypothetical protein